MSSAVYSTDSLTSYSGPGTIPQVKEKTRNLSTFDYLEVLSSEYVVAEIRKKIYPHSKDKAFYAKTMSHKRAKIEDIASRNSLPTMFNDTKVKEAIYSRIIPAFGLPNFSYKNEEVRAELEAKDIANYYAQDGEVKVMQKDTSLKFGVLCNANVNTGVAYVMYKGETAPDTCNLAELARIL
jgi:hypothetical protein